MNIDVSSEDLSLMGFEESPVALMILSRRRVVRVNSELTELFGWERHDLEGQSVRILYPSSLDYEAIGARWIDLLANRQRYEDERFMQKRSGEIFWAKARGRTMTPHNPFELMIWTFEASVDKRRHGVLLTVREREIAQLIVNGLTSKSIGRLLGISPRTVETHRNAIMRKLDVRNIAELVAKIIVEL